MNRKAELATFFASLILIGIVLTGSIFYFSSQKNTADISLAPTSTSVQVQNPQQVAETIPTSTVILTASSSSNIVQPLYLPYTFNIQTATSTYWPKAWGTLSYLNNDLTLIPDPTTHGANSFLNGASAWTNYIVNADTSELMGGWFDIVARVTNSQQNFVYCEFGPNGTEVIERADSADAQIAYAAASTTNATENFGMEVYGNDVGCLMNGREIVGAQISQNESLAGGIGFVTFGQPATQKGVAVSEISATPLSIRTITVPFPTAPTPPAPTVTTTNIQTETLPYSLGILGNSFVEGDGWLNWWGGSSQTNGVLNIMAIASSTGGGVLLQGSNMWTDYTFQATVDWQQGETFGLIARYIDDNNYLACEYQEDSVGDVHLRLDQHLNGNVTPLADGDILNYNELYGANIPVAIQVNGNQGSCAFDGHVISSLINSNSINSSLSHGEIGVTSWDPTMDNSQIVVTNIGVTAGAHELGSYTQQTSD